MFGSEKRLWEELRGMYMIRLVRNWQEASQLAPCPAFSCPHPGSPVLPPPPPGLAGMAKGLDVHTPAPSTLKKVGSPLLCLVFVPLAWVHLLLPFHVPFFCLCSLISHDFANYTLLLSDLLLAPNSRKKRRTQRSRSLRRELNSL